MRQDDDRFTSGGYSPGQFPGVMNSSLFMHPPYWDESDLMILRKSGYPGDASLVKSQRHNDERHPVVLFIMPVSMPNRPDWPAFIRISEPAEKFTESQV